MSGSQWYAAYTYPRHEKKAAECLRLRGIDTFLPLYRESRLWKNGIRRIVEAPLFPGYVFVNITIAERIRVLQSPSIACLVGQGGIPSILPHHEIERLQIGSRDSSLRPHPYIEIGDRVRIKSGPLAQIEGVLLSFKNQWRVVLCIDLLRQAASVEVELSELERLPFRKGQCA